MAPGTLVIYTMDPLLYGKMMVRRVLKDGRLECESIHKDETGTYPREGFHAQELEHAERWAVEEATA